MHKHEWRIMPCSWDMGIQAICSNVECEAEMNSDEIERTLNSHTDLLEALELLVTRVRTLEDQDIASGKKKLLISSAVFGAEKTIAKAKE